MSLVTTPAILLRSHPYSETSQILRFYTVAHGIQGMVARGVRKAGGKHGGSVATFSQGTLTLFHREQRDLQTFKDFSPTKTRRGLSRHPLRLAAHELYGLLAARPRRAHYQAPVSRRPGAGDGGLLGPRRRGGAIPTMTEPCDLSAVEARRLIGIKQLSPVELLESCLERIGRVDGALNAIFRDGNRK